MNIQIASRMKNSETIFLDIVNRLSTEDEDVCVGKMMSSPGIKFKDKVFAFLHKESMGFRLGPSFNPDESGLQSIHPLSPFKTKAPLKGWYVVDAEEHDSWEALAKLALDFTRTL